jgi:hypothetical protein
VPGPSAAALIDACGAKDKQHLHLPGGHVGAVVSKHAAKTLWPQLVAFYERHDAPPGKSAPLNPAPETSSPGRGPRTGRSSAGPGAKSLSR